MIRRRKTTCENFGHCLARGTVVSFDKIDYFPARAPALGKTIVDRNEGYDDWDGPDARSCRFPEVLFTLNVDGLPKTLPDSARVTSVEINVRRRETMGSFCRP